jgi:O-antigen/teichoic acid export membrane protein
VAFYDIANQIFLITATFIFLAIDYLIPIFTGLISTGKEAKLLHWSKLIIRYTTILCMMTFWAFMFTGRDFIPLIFGPGFGNIFPNGVVLLLSIFPMALVQLGYVFSVVYKEPLKYFRALVLAFAVFLTAGIVLIPRYASVGCAFATFASCTVLSITLCVMFRDELLPCLTGALKAAAPGIVFLPFILLRQGLAVDLALLIIAASAYLFVLLANQSLRIVELKEIVRAIRHRPEESYADAPVGGRMP